MSPSQSITIRGKPPSSSMSHPFLTPVPSSCSTHSSFHREGIADTTLLTFQLWGFLQQPCLGAPKAPHQAGNAGSVLVMASSSEATAQTHHARLWPPALQGCPAPPARFPLALQHGSLQVCLVLQSTLELGLHHGHLVPQLLVHGHEAMQLFLQLEGSQR